MSTTFYTLTVRNVNRETNDSVSIHFDLPNDLKDQFSFVPGQYLTLRKTINGEEVRRSYSICTAPHENELAVSVKAIENGLFSSFANQELKAGDQLEVMPPEGNFIIKTNEDHAKTYVFYAAGSGITPVISMVKAILKEEPSSKVFMYYGNKSRENTIFKGQLDTLDTHYENFNLSYLYSREESGTPLTNGRIDDEKCGVFCDRDHSNLGSIDGVYACGPEEMIMTVKNFYLDKGLEKSKIHFELFTVSVPKENVSVESGAAVDSEVTVIIDDEEFEFTLNSNGKDILQAAQDEDADVPFSCKGGVCCTCKAKVLEGTVRMDLNFALEEDEVENGFVLTCQSHPTSAKVVISYDEF